jgi:reactive intermediate/imine deaminase
MRICVVTFSNPVVEAFSVLPGDNRHDYPSIGVQGGGKYGPNCRQRLIFILIWRNNMNLILKTMAVTAFFLSQAAVAGEVEVEYHAVSPDMQLPFSEAVRVGHMLYLSGQLGYDSKTSSLVEGGIAAETRQTLENIKAVLEKHGSSMAEVVKCTVFLADIKEWAAMNAVYITYFPSNPPARSALGSSGLALDARTEIECMATVKN